jgi:hypothetical protein
MKTHLPKLAACFCAGVVTGHFLIPGGLFNGSSSDVAAPGQTPRFTGAAIRHGNSVGHSSAPPQSMAHSKRISETNTYALRYESAEARARLDDFIGRMVQRSFVTKGPEYAALFASYGIPAGKSIVLVRHAEKIHQAAMEAEAGIKQALEARADFKQELAGLIGPEQLASFENHEKTAQARFEVEQIQRYLAENGKASLTSDQRAVLSESIHRAEAYIDLLPQHGIYDELGPVVVGEDAVIDYLGQDYERIKDKSGGLLAELEAAGFSGDILDELQAYYDSRAEGRNKAIEWVKNLESVEHEERRFANRLAISQKK